MKISVVTGYYNRAHVLERTIRSILDQDFEDFELLVFDDASSDGTVDKLKRLSQELKDSRFRYIVHDRNMGFVHGLRDAIEQTTGEYIAIQGSGDVSLQQRLTLQNALLDERPEVGAVGSWYTNVEEQTASRRLRQPDADQIGFAELLKGNVFSHGEVMFRRDVYEQVGRYRVAFKNCQDYDLWLRMARVAKFATVPVMLYDRYIQFDGVTYNPKKLINQARYVLLTQRIAQLAGAEEQLMLDRLEAEGPTPLIPADDPALQKEYVKAVLRFALWGARDEAIDLSQAVITSPAKRKALIAFTKLYNSRPASPVRASARKMLGISNTH